MTGSVTRFLLWCFLTIIIGSIYMLPIIIVKKQGSYRGALGNARRYLRVCWTLFTNGHLGHQCFPFIDYKSLWCVSIKSWKSWVNAQIENTTAGVQQEKKTICRLLFFQPLTDYVNTSSLDKTTREYNDVMCILNTTRDMQQVFVFSRSFGGFSYTLASLFFLSSLGLLFLPLLIFPSWSLPSFASLSCPPFLTLSFSLPLRAGEKINHWLVDSLCSSSHPDRTVFDIDRCLPAKNQLV